MISNELEHILQHMYEEAQHQRHDVVGLEHLLLSLLQYTPDITEILRSCGADPELLTAQLKESILDNTPTVAEYNTDFEPTPTLGFQRVMQRAVIHAQNAGKQEVLPKDLLVPILDEQDSHAAYFLQLHSVNRMDLLRILSHGNAFTPKRKEDEESEGMPAAKPLEAYTINLNEEVRAGRIDPLIGRKNEMERLLQILCRRRKNNPLLVGEAGVGKTALAEGLAHLLVHHEVPQMLEGATVFALDMGALLAGAKYRGDFEARVKAVLQELANLPKSILFIDEIHTVIGAGSTQGSTIDASNLLKPALAKGTLRCIGATTYEEYRSIFNKDHALSRRFQKIDINEPDIDDTVAILQGLKPMFEKHHEIRYTDEALQAAAELSAKYINERFLPDKAIDVIDEAGAAQRLVAEEERPEALEQSHIESVVAKIARIPEKNVSHNDKQILQHLARNLKNMVFGQDDAIEALASAVKLSRSGLGLPDKPIGCFLFSGPTGVGKTEVAKQLAYSLGVPLQRFDMSEYMEAHSVSRLIGAPPGYVGYEQAGLLTDAVAKQPHCVLLLDEIEKAHHDIYNILLQVMDHGKLTDNNGKSADFRNVVLIMTTNAGAETLSKSNFGFTGKHERGDEMLVIKKYFTPEFRNRLDAVIPFAPLTPQIIARVVDKFLLQLEQQLHTKQVEAEFTPALRQYLTKAGFDPQMGARPMNRLIQDKVRKALADELLFGKLTEGGRVCIDWSEQEGRAVLSFPNKRRNKQENPASSAV